MIDTGGAVESFVAAKCSVQFIFGVGGVDIGWGYVGAIQSDGSVAALVMAGYSWHE